MLRSLPSSKNCSMSASSTSQEVIVRKVTRKFIADALLLIGEYYDEIGVVLRDSYEDLLHYVDDSKSGIWIAYVGVMPAGCVVLRPLAARPNCDEIKRLYVRHAFRHMGIAHALMQALEADARTRATQWLYLDTKDDLDDAIRLYEQQGYMSCERYNNNPQATLFLRKSLRN
jgi:GNAT superfamily N-acetyltransferase